MGRPLIPVGLGASPGRHGRRFASWRLRLSRSRHGDYLLIYTSAKDLPAADQALSGSQLPLVREFDQLMTDTVDMEKAVALESIYHTPYW
jgi:hypothetical protein